MTRDLTVGKPMGLILSFALPTLFGMLFQQFYNMVDTMIVGKLLGANALGAVGSTGAICFFVIGFCMGLCNGFAIPVAQRTGAGDGRNMRFRGKLRLSMPVFFRGAHGGHHLGLPLDFKGHADPRRAVRRRL